MAPRKAFPLRIDPRVHAALERWAGDEMRSVNAQIEFLLRQALLRAGRLDAGPGLPGPATPDSGGAPTTDDPPEADPA